MGNERSQKITPGHVREENGTVSISGLERMTHGTGVPNSYVSAFTSLIHACGINLSYSYLLGISGMAFQVVVDSKNGPRIPLWNSDLGLGCIDSLWQAAGCLCREISLEGTDTSARDFFTKSIRETLLSGFPLIAYDLEGPGLDGVIAGIDTNDIFLCRLNGDDQNLYRHCDIPLSRVAAPGEAPLVKIKHPAYMDAFRRAVAIAETGIVSRGAESIAVGIQAYYRWAEWLRDEAARCELDHNELFESMKANSVLFQWLVDARISLPGFIRDAGSEMVSPLSANALAEAASLYARLSDRLKSGIPFVEHDLEHWGPMQRGAQADILEESAKTELKAIQCIKETVR